MANLLARGIYTIAVVSDGYTLSLSAASLSISANHDGTNADLENAYTIVTLSKGNVEQNFNIINVIPSSDGIEYSYQRISNAKWKVAITGISPTVKSGYLDIAISTADNYKTSARFSFSVVRNTAGIEWIEEWNGTYNQIGENYVITPKLFAGHKDSDGKITGIYLGKLKGFIGEVFPFTLSDPEEGIYGYRDNKIVFFINNKGASIGGWEITPNAIQCSDGTLTIKSEGAISSQHDGVVNWSLNKDGSASFANGNVKFYKNGDAEFAGKITSSSGNIGGWQILKNQLYNSHIIIDSRKQFIGIYTNDIVEIDKETGDFLFPNSVGGGVKMWYTSHLDFGLAGWSNSNKVFQLGSSNSIACWNFDNDAMWIGVKNNNNNQYTGNSGDLTIGNKGLRGNSWYINADGTTSFVKGLVTFNKDSGKIANWTIANSRIATDNVAICADEVKPGIYMTNWNEGKFVESSADAMESWICNNGGIYWRIEEKNVVFAAYDSGSGCLFSIKNNDTCTIASWNFNDVALWTGAMKTTGFTNSGDITISYHGIRGYKWRLENDGSGGIAGDKIKWDKNGVVTLDSGVKVGWNNLGGTIIDSNGVFAGKIKADNITAGTISTASITCLNKWMLNQDGSGYLANKHITWDTAGNVKIEGEIVATSGTIGGIQIYKDHIGVAPDGNISLSIYKDFFQVGNNTGYVIFTDNIYPGTSSGQFSSVGKIVNGYRNAMSDSVNYGLQIDVSGAKKNYGIKSNAPVMATSFLSTKAKILAITDTYKPSFDFSEHNIILLSYTSSQYGSIDINMPAESAVANWFGFGTSLPSDFATMITIRIRQGSKQVTLKNIYNHDEALTNYAMKPGDSVIILCSKIDGFRYQIVNYTSNA